MVYEGVTGVWRRMIYTRHFCAKCGSAAISRNGSKKGQPKTNARRAATKPVRAGGGAQSRPIRAGRCPVERALLAAQHCPAHGYGPQADCQTNKKKRRSFRRPCCRGARPKPSASGGKCSGSMSSGALWAPKDEKCGAGWSSNAPGGALAPGQPGRSPVAQAVAVVADALPPTLLFITYYSL